MSKSEDNEKDDTNPSIRAYSPAKDSGGFDKARDDKRDKTSPARAFDSLVASNLSLTQYLRVVMFAVIVTCLLVLTTTLVSAFMLHTGQRETRDLLIAISQRPRLCTQVEEQKK